MRHPDNRTFSPFFTLSFQRQIGDHSLCMLMYHIRTRALIAPEGIYICIIPIHQYPCLYRFQRRWKQIGRPESAILGRPCFLRVAVQTMDEDYIDLGVGMSIYLRDLITIYFRGRYRSALSRVSIDIPAVTSFLSFSRSLDGLTMVAICEEHFYEIIFHRRGIRSYICLSGRL